MILKGPEIRTELFVGDVKSTLAKTGENFRVATKQGIKSTCREVIALNVAGALDIYDDVEVGRQVLADDGKLGLLALLQKTMQLSWVWSWSWNEWNYAKQKVWNIPNIKIPFQLLLNDDDIRFGVWNKVSTSMRFHLYVLRKTLTKFVQSVKKLWMVMFTCLRNRNQQGIDNLRNIEGWRYCDRARGDMGIEVPFEMVPVYQNDITK